MWTRILQWLAALGLIVLEVDPEPEPVTDSAAVRVRIVVGKVEVQ